MRTYFCFLIPRTDVSARFYMRRALLFVMLSLFSVSSEIREGVKEEAACQGDDNKNQQQVLAGEPPSLNEIALGVK